MKKLLLIGLWIVLACQWNSCEKDTLLTSDNDSDIEDGISHEEESDYLWETSSEVTITLTGTAISAGSESVAVNGTVATITEAGNYRITGSLENGQIVVDAPDAMIRLIFDGVSIINSSASAIISENSTKTIIYLAEGSVNTLADGNSYTNAGDDPNAALFSKTDLTLFGEGTLIVNGNYQDGISSKDGLIIKSGIYNITAKDDGVRGKDYLAVKGGNIIVNCGGDGMISDNDLNTSVGYVKIENGEIDITSGGDGISAQTSVTATGGEINIVSGGGSNSSVSGDASAKGIKGLLLLDLAFTSCTINAAVDALHSNNEIIIQTGNYILSSADDGIHSDTRITINNGTLKVTKSNEGFESHYITINDGDINIVSSDDSFNATAGNRTEQDDNSQIYIYGGRMVLNGSAGDPLDSNGSIVMTGGSVIIHGPASQPEVGIDYNGSFNISGGFLIASGTSSNMTQAPSTSSQQCSLKIMYSSSLSTSTLFHIQDAEGNEVATFQPLRKYQSIIFSAPALTSGGSYSIYKSGSSTGVSQYGLYTEGTYSPGTLLKTFTISNKVTTLSNL